MTSIEFADSFYGPIVWDSETVIQGTSYDAFSAIGTVDVSLRDDTGGGTFFNGQDWTSSSEQWFRADGQENWSFSIALSGCPQYITRPLVEAGQTSVAAIGLG